MRRMVIGAILLAVVFCMAAGAVLFAQTTGGGAQSKPAEPKYTEVKYQADASSYRWQGDDRILALAGNVKFVQGDTIILADKVDYREKTRTANASGNLKIYDDRNTITGEACTVNFKEKKGTITGNVQMLAKPKPKPEDEDKSKQKLELKDEVTITCASIDYYYKEKKAVVPTAVTIVQKDRTITADSATYIGKNEIVQLAGNVKAHDEKGKHDLSAPKVTVSLKDTDQWIEAEKATGSFFVKEEEEETPSQPTPTQEEKPAPK